MTDFKEFMQKNEKSHKIKDFVIRKNADERHTIVETLCFLKNFNVIIKNGATKKAKRIIFSFGFEVFVILHIFFDFFTSRH